jgi:hypothetical protein
MQTPISANAPPIAADLVIREGACPNAPAVGIAGKCADADRFHPRHSAGHRRKSAFASSGLD